MTETATVVSHPAAAPAAANLIAIASGKGGVGKTWLAVTLSQALVGAGERVLLFDGDLGLANADVQLGLMPERDLGHVISGRASLAEVVTPCAAVGYDIIAGMSGSGGLAAIGRDRMAALCAELATLCRDYDRVVADLGAGLGEDVRRLAACAGKIVVVATDEPTSLTDAYAFIKVIAARSLGAATSIVVNLAASERAGQRTYKALATACRSFLGIEPPLLGIVRRDARVADAIRHQTATLTRHPTSDAAADVEAVARRLMEDR